MTGGPPSAGDRTAGSAVDPLAASGGRCRAPNRQPGPTRASASTAISLFIYQLNYIYSPFGKSGASLARSLSYVLHLTLFRIRIISVSENFH